MVAGLVKVLQIKSVVPDLINGRPIECAFANLKFDHEYDVINQS